MKVMLGHFRRRVAAAHTIAGRKTLVLDSEQAASQRYEAVGAMTEQSSISEAQLQEANEHLVLATLNAQTMKTAAEQAASQLREANEHLVVATVNARRMTGIAKQATAQITYLAKLEIQLQEAQKLETLGALAGGVAHDFNNLLTAIVSNANLGSLAVAPDSKVAHYFEVIETASMRAVALTRQLLDYAGKGPCLVMEVDLNLVVKEIAQVLAVSIPRHVSLNCEQSDRIPFVRGDSTQIFQILMNLITNATEAFAEDAEGQITVRTRAEAVDEKGIEAGGWALAVTPGPYATVEVTDTGSGMEPTLLARIFEPFFTTKFTGRGLGLAATLGIVRSHGGGLRVQSEPGRGSSFKIFLPSMQAVQSLPTPEPLPFWPGQDQRSVVDEDRAARSTAQQIAEHRQRRPSGAQQRIQGF